jgi:hypothetical protein
MPEIASTVLTQIAKKRIAAPREPDAAEWPRGGGGDAPIPTVTRRDLS